MSGRMATRATKPSQTAANVRSAETSVRERIEVQRRQLQRASAVLACLMLAADQELEVDLGDVAAVARELIQAALLGLDSANLQAAS